MGMPEGQMQGQPVPVAAMAGENVRGCPPLSREVQRERCLAAASEMKEFLLNAPQRVDTERLTYLLEAYKEFDYEPTDVLRAQFFAKLLHKRTIFIDQNPLVGTVTGHHAGVYVYPEWDSQWIRHVRRLPGKRPARVRGRPPLLPLLFHQHRRHRRGQRPARTRKAPWPWSARRPRPSTRRATAPTTST